MIHLNFVHLNFFAPDPSILASPLLNASKPPPLFGTLGPPSPSPNSSIFPFPPLLLVLPGEIIEEENFVGR